MSVTVTTSTAVVTVTSDVSATVVTSGAASATVNENQAVVASTLIGVDSIQSPVWVQMNTTGVATPAVGRFWWNDTDGTLNVGLKGGNVTLQVGQESVQLVKSSTNDGLAEGKVVYLVGSDGNNITAAYAQADAEAKASKTFGVMTEAAVGGGKGFCTTFGLVRNINTSALTEGAIVWLSPTVVGGMTTTKPTAPDHSVVVGLCVRSHATNGVVFVSAQNGYELGELHDVLISSPADNQVLTYEASTGLWKNKTNTVDGVQSVVFDAPLTGGTVSSSGTVGLDQSALSIGRSQVTDFAGGSVAYATTAGSASTAGAASTADYASTAGTAVGLSGDVAQSQVTGLVSALAGKAALTADQTFTGLQTFIPSSAASRAILLQSAASQSSNIMEWRNSSNVLLGRIDQNGSLSAPFIGSTSSASYIQFNGDTNSVQVFAGGAAMKALTIKGAASQTANLTEWQNSSAQVRAAVTASGHIYSLDRITAGGYNTNSLGQFTAISTSSTLAGAVIRGAASQSANLTEWQDSAGALLARITSSGSFRTGLSIKHEALDAVVASLAFNAPTASAPVAVFRGAASQSANLQEWQNSAGSVLARVSSSGGFSANFVQTLNAEVQLSGPENSGGAIRITKQTAAAANPGSGLAKIYLRDGTNAGTLKLVVRAGAAGAETTILDNIPQ